MTLLPKLEMLKAQRPSTVLGLNLDGSRLEGVVVRRTNGAMKIEQPFAATLSLDLLTNAPELVGREIRNHLEKAEVRERRCVVCVPLTWALTVHTKVPELPEADVASFLQIEAERGFPSAVETLVVATSRYRASNGEQRAMLVGVSRSHLSRLEAVLRAAQLKPVSFSLGLTALEPADAEASNGVLALAVAEDHVGLQITEGGGVVALRALEGAIDREAGVQVLRSDLVASETRITLGQLSDELRESVRVARIFGQRESAQKLADEVRLSFASLGLQVEHVTTYDSGEFSSRLPAGTLVSPALSLAARYLTGHPAAFELLPPKVTAWQQFGTRYASKKLGVAGVIAAALLLLVGGGLLFQQWQLSRLRSEWAGMATRAQDLEALQQQIKKFRPWFDDSARTLSILRRLTEAFPEDGVVSAKTLEIRELSTVICSGSARDNSALLKALDQLRGAREVSDLKVDQIRGKAPLQFTFDFRWNEGGRSEN